MSGAAVITTGDFVGAFESLGMTGVTVQNGDQVLQAVQSLVQKGGFGLILITSNVADEWSASSMAERLVVPVVLVIPATTAASAAATSSVRRLIENAVGVDIVGKMTEEKSHGTR